MNQLSTADRARIVSLLCEGVSIRASVRLTGFSKNTITKLVVDLGEAVAAYQEATLRGLTCKRLQLDEIWGFCYAKAKNVPKAKAAPAGAGDVWLWTALDADTKLIPCWHVGTRDSMDALRFMEDLKSRLTNRPQITTDGHSAYIPAVETVFGAAVDYAQLVKLYGKPSDQAPEARYSPVRCLGTRRAVIAGSPDTAHVSTSYVECQNRTLRMHNRRYTRLTNAHSKKFANHAAAVAISMMHHNFCRVHETIRCTPAMEAGITDHVWEMEEVVALLEAKPVKSAA